MTSSNLLGNIKNCLIGRIRIRSNNFRAPTGEGVICSVGRNLDRCLTIINGKCICVNDAGLKDRAILVPPGDFVAFLQVGIVDVLVIGGAVVKSAGAVGNELESIVLADRNGVGSGRVVDRFRVGLARRVGDVGVSHLTGSQTFVLLCTNRNTFRCCRGLVISDLISKVIDSCSVERSDVCTDIKRSRIADDQVVAIFFCIDAHVEVFDLFTVVVLSYDRCIAIKRSGTFELLAELEELNVRIRG